MRRLRSYQTEDLLQRQQSGPELGSDLSALRFASFAVGSTLPVVCFLKFSVWLYHDFINQKEGNVGSQITSIVKIGSVG